MKKVSFRTVLPENFGILGRPFFECTFYRKMKILKYVKIYGFLLPHADLFKEKLHRRVKH
jgi:hypothetical protein